MAVPIRDFRVAETAQLRELALLLRVPEVPLTYQTEIERLALNYPHRLPNVTLGELFRGDWMEVSGCANLQAVCGAYISTSP